MLYNLLLFGVFMGEDNACSVTLQEKAVRTGKPQSDKSWPERGG